MNNNNNKINLFFLYIYFSSFDLFIYFYLSQIFIFLNTVYTVC